MNFDSSGGLSAEVAAAPPGLAAALITPGGGVVNLAGDMDWDKTVLPILLQGAFSAGAAAGQRVQIGDCGEMIHLSNEGTLLVRAAAEGGLVLVRIAQVGVPEERELEQVRLWADDLLRRHAAQAVRLERRTNAAGGLSDALNAMPRGGL